MLFTDDYYDYVGTFEYRWTCGLILDSTYKLPNKTYDSRSSKHPFADCTKALLLTDHEQGNIDPYNILMQNNHHEGYNGNRGVNYRTLEALFIIAKETSETFTYDISVIVLKVYNEKIRDILAPPTTSKRLMRHKETKVLLAMKYIERGHKVVSTPTHLAIVMEYAAGGELFERIYNAGRRSQVQALEIASGRNTRPKSTARTPAQIAPEVLSRREYEGKQKKKEKI
ncbi:hypothetical protein FXO37_13166 [Capsicum annuum]|nr:hypothetical protein FXO37_13166 [Capsicum annuum]